MTPKLPERLRDAAQKLRTSNILLADFIPLLQQAADAIAAQGVPDGVVLQIDAAVTQAQKVLSDWNEWYGMHGEKAPLPPGGIVKAQELLAVAKSLLASAPPAPQAAHLASSDPQAHQQTITDHAAEQAAVVPHGPKFWAPPERDGAYHAHDAETVYRTPKAGWYPLYTHPAQQTKPQATES